MGRINITIPDDLEKELRIEIAKQGGKKGDISKVIQEAISQWIERKKKG